MVILPSGTNGLRGGYYALDFILNLFFKGYLVSVKL